MKKFMSCFLAVLASALPAASGNLLSNGGFEEVDASGLPAGWYVFDEGGGAWQNHRITFQSEPNVVKSGNRAAAMIHSAPDYPSWVMLRQDVVDFAPGDYVLTGNVYWTGKSMARPCVTLHLIDRHGGLSHPLVFQIWNKPTPEGWVPFRYPFTVDSNVRVIGVNAIASDGPAQAYVDDLGLWPAEEAPPAPDQKPEIPPVIPETAGHPVVRLENATPRVVLQQSGDNWYLVAPGGTGFWDLGVNHCSYPAANSWWDRLAPDRGTAVRAVFPDPRDWERDTAARLKAWGFTSLGAWSYTGILEEAEKRGLHFWVALGISAMGKQRHYLRNRAGADIPVGGTSRMADPFDPEWQADVDAAVAEVTASLRDSPAVIGFFVDNEISLGVVPLCGYIASPHTAGALSEWLRKRYGDIGRLNQAWNEHYRDFDEIAVRPPDYASAPEGSSLPNDLELFEDYLVERYVDFAVRTIRKYAPDALIASPRLPGERLAEYAPLRHFARFDIVAVNCYGGTFYSEAQLRDLRRIHQITGRPVLITEWTVGATDMNHGGAVETQAERAGVYRDMVRQLSNEPYIVGMHYQMWFSPEAIGGNQFGLVTSEEKPYPDFTEAVAAFQRESWP